MTYIINPLDKAPDGAHMLVLSEHGVEALASRETEMVILDVASWATGEIHEIVHVVDEAGLVLVRLMPRETTTSFIGEMRPLAGVLAAAQEQLGAYGSASGRR